MNTDIAELIKARRTIHQFETGKCPDEKIIRSAIEHAVYAPNHHLTEPWHFRLLGRETVAKICHLNAELVSEKLGAKAGEIKLKRWLEIPGWLLLSCTKSEDDIRAMEDYASCCCAAQNFMLYLWQHGIGVKWTTGDVTRDRKFFSMMDMDPEQEKVVGLFWYGYAAAMPQVNRKRNMDVIIKLK